MTFRVYLLVPEEFATANEAFAAAKAMRDADTLVCDETPGRSRIPLGGYKKIAEIVVNPDGVVEVKK